MIRNGYVAWWMIVLSARLALADEVIEIEGRAPGEPVADRDRTLADRSLVTVLKPDDRAPTATVADALATTAGVHRTSLGGAGAFAAVSIRGASAGHTAILVDGVPLARIASVTADLGRHAMASLGRVDLYRGSVPLELGGAGVGGAINLVSRLGRGEGGERWHLSTGGGSFGARHARAEYGDHFARWQTLVTVGYQGATGDYRHFSDGGTPLNPSDDTTIVRRNNRYDQLDVAVRGGRDDREAGGLRVITKHQGLPGSVAQPALAAELTTVDTIVDGHGELSAGRATARQLGYALVEWQRYRDLAGELGLGAQDRGYLTLSAGAASAWTIPLADQRILVGGELRGDRFRDRDRRGTRGDQVGTRIDGALSLAGDFAATRTIAIAPAIRLDGARTHATPMVEGPQASDVPVRRDYFASPRVAARLGIAGDAALKASLGRYVRLPTLLELFGNRGGIVGSPELRSERGSAADVGVVWAPTPRPSHAIDRVLVQAAAFATRAVDTIALVSTGGFVARAENVGASESYGGELVATARIARRLSLSASATVLSAHQRSTDPNLDRKAIPRTPRYAGYVRSELAGTLIGRAIETWFEAHLQASSFLDQANFQRVPGRALLGGGVRVSVIDRIHASITVDNAFDVRVVELAASRPGDPTTPAPLADLSGFPLPGRAFYLAVDWAH